MLTVVMFVCVLYAGGERYCDVRSNRAINHLTLEECNQRLDAGLRGLVADALTNEDVVLVFKADGSCNGDIETTVKTLADFGYSYTHTEY